MRAKSRLDAYERYRTHHGQRLVIADNLSNQPVAAGRIYEIEPDGRWVHYIAAGVWQEHERELDVSSYTSTTETDDVIKTALSDHVDPVSTDTSNVDATGTDIGTEWTTRASTGGIYTSRLITELLEMSDSSGNIWDYWCIEAPFDGIGINKPIPYLKARSESAAIDWQVRLADLSGKTLVRHIWNLTRDITTYYGATPTATAGSTSAETDLWTVEKAPRAELFSLTPANQFEDKELAVFEKPVQQQDFAIGAPWIRDGVNARWPLWEMIKRGPGYIRINDLYPTAELLATSSDRTNVFFTAALDYDYASNTMRVVPDLPDRRLDALLGREKALTEVGGEMVERYEKPRLQGAGPPVGGPRPQGAR